MAFNRDVRGRETVEAAAHLSTVRMAMKVAQKLTQLVIMDDISDARTPMPITWKIWGAAADTSTCQQEPHLKSKALLRGGTLREQLWCNASKRRRSSQQSLQQILAALRSWHGSS
jgi:hypothetical protein